MQIFYPNDLLCLSDFPMNNPLGVSPLLVKGIREPHEVKKKSFDLGGNRTHNLRLRSTITLPTEIPGPTEKVGDN